MEHLLVTGATGFVGRALCAALAPRHRLSLVARNLGAEPLPAGTAVHRVSEIGPNTQWGTMLEGIDAVVHLAAHVHVQGSAAAEATFMRVNCDGTLRLAEAARHAGIRRFVYLSTAKVHGEASGNGRFREDDPPRPEGPYAASKWLAEQGLASIAAGGGPATTILRPPLVYGPGAKANVATLLRACRLGLPLPFGAVENRRSLLFLGNLVSAIGAVLEAPPVPGCRTYLLRDGEDLSTPELIRRLAGAAGRRARLVGVPPRPLSALLRLAGGDGLANRLLDSFAIDDARFRRELGWTPPHGVDEGLAATAARPDAAPSGRRAGNPV